MPLHRLPFTDRLTPRASVAMDTARWGASLLVLLYHLCSAVLAPLPASPGPVSRLFAALGECGPPAVIWFFVLSGALIGGGVLADMRADRFSFRRYLLNRATRLYLVLLPALALGYALDAARIARFGFSPVAGQEAAANYTPLAFLGNLLCLQTLAVPTLGSNGPLWSLACEGWYYLLFPLLLAPLLRTRTRQTRLLCLAAAIALLAVLTAGNPRISRLFLAWILGAGLRLCPLPIPRSPSALRRLTWLGRTAWLVAVVVMLNYTALLARCGGLVNLLIAGSFALALATTLADTRPASPPLKRLSARLAGFSFSLYLIHVPILHALIALSNESRDTSLGLPRNDWTSYVAMLALAAVLLGVSWVFSRVTEARTADVRDWIGRGLIRGAEVQA